MHEAEFLRNIVVLFGTAVAVSWFFRVLKAPSIIGFLATGMVIGPHAWGLMAEDSVSQFAEIGLVLLLFTVGLELSPEPLLRMGSRLFAATGLQMGGIGLIATLAMWLVGGQTLPVALLIGIAVSLSSTAIVLKQLSDRGEVNSTQGNLVTGVLLLQDIFVILVMALLPLFASGGEEGHGPGRALMAFGILAVGVVVLRKILPSVLGLIIRFGGRELTTLFAVLMACGGAWAAQLAGWSPALGACVAGLLLANVDIRHQLVAEITPFRDVFNALFFISLGMLVPIDMIVEHGIVLAILVVVVIVIKATVTALAIRVAGWPTRIAVQSGMGLSTVSEFGFVLILLADDLGLAPEGVLDEFMILTVGTMAIGALLNPISIPFSEWLERRSGTHVETEVSEDEAALQECNEHVIIIGYGVNGHNMMRVLKAAHIGYSLVEMNRSLVKQAHDDGVPVVVGDATRRSILEHAGLGRARAVVVAVNDSQATRRIVSQVRAARNDIYIIARTYYAQELEALTRAGANVVVPADFEASVKIFSHVLEEFDVPRNILAAQVASVRAGGYGVMRGKSSSSPEAMQDLVKVLQMTATQTFFLPEDSCACGMSIRALDLRRMSGATIIAVVRDREPHTNPGPEFVLQSQDVLVLVGAHVQLRTAQDILEAGMQLTPAPPDVTEAQP